MNIPVLRSVLFSMVAGLALHGAVQGLGFCLKGVHPTRLQTALFALFNLIVIVGAAWLILDQRFGW